MPEEHIHFVTGKLAEYSLRKHLTQLSTEIGFEFSVGVLPITVAALMTPKWIARHLDVPQSATRVLIPGYCEGELDPITKHCQVPVERGPRDLHDLAAYFGKKTQAEKAYGDWDIEILAEINHAPRLTRAEILKLANHYRDSGATLIDVGCDPGDPWSDVGDCVSMLRSEGHRVSIDSLNPDEIEPAVAAGAGLVLSVNSTNRERAVDWGCEVVVVPDEFETLQGLDETVNLLASANVPLRIDPILEPIGFGFAASLKRYYDVRQRYPDAEMMMGIGNLTELTEVDSAGVNVVLLALCQELGIRSVLTTEVIHWARSSVAECDIGRKLSHFAVKQQRLPKHVDSRLVMLRGGKPNQPSPDELDKLAEAIRDHNYRLFTSEGEVHLVAAGLHLCDKDPFQLFQQLMQSQPKNVDPSHAFYLGFEMAKAATALTLGKQYTQDESLNWGLLTQEETHHRLKISGSRQP